MEQIHPHPLLAVTLGLLGIVGLVAVLARRVAVSYPVLLILAGLLCSLLPQVPDIQLTPNMVFYVFLPPLLYSAAWQTSWREFRYNLFSIAMLAVGLVFFTAVGVALTAHFFLPGFDWRMGFLLGAICSPTDAVAATSMARRMGLPHRIVDLLEGESLLNDATGLLALQFGLSLLEGSAPHAGHAAAELLWLLGGGLVAGLAVGWVSFTLERWVEEGPVEVVLSLLVAYISYLAGEAVHASGVIAVVVCGLYLSRKSATFLSPESRLQILSFWDALEFLLNGLVFLLIGMQLSFVLPVAHGPQLWRLCLHGIGFAGVLIALRLLWMYPAARFSYAVRTRWLGQTHPRPGRKSVFVLGWTGMRGVVALAAAGTLPQTIAGKPFPQRPVIVFLTFCVILVTLVGQGLTLPAVVKLLRLPPDGDVRDEENRARQTLYRAAIRLLKERHEGAPESEQHAIEDLLHMFQHREEELQMGQEEQSPHPGPSHELRLAVFEAQRRQLNGLRETGEVGDAVYRSLERELDLGQSRMPRPQAG